MKLTKSRLKQLIKEEIEAIKEVIKQEKTFNFPDQIQIRARVIVDDPRLPKNEGRVVLEGFYKKEAYNYVKYVPFTPGTSDPTPEQIERYAKFHGKRFRKLLKEEGLMK